MMTMPPAKYPGAPPHFLAESYKKHIENEIPAVEDLANVILFCDLPVFIYAPGK